MKIDKSFLANTVLATLVGLITWSLWSIGERRIDVYVALYTLSYLVIKAVLNPRRKGLDWLAVALTIVFFVCVAYRVYEVLIH